MTTSSIEAAQTNTARTTFEADPLTIDVTVDFNNQLSVSNTFVCVPEHASRKITWKLHQDPADRRIIVFDHPPVRILTSPDTPQPVFYPVGEPASHSVTFEWDNANPALFGTSFAYRVHAVIINGDGTFTPVQSDPIIRNDPPPAP